MIPYRVTIKIIRNSNFKKHNTLLKDFLKIINSTYKDLYYALNNNLNCITMNYKSEISDNQIIYAKYLSMILLMSDLKELKSLNSIILKNILMKKLII